MGSRRGGLRSMLPLLKAVLSLIPQGRVTTYSSIGRLLGVHPRLAGMLLAMNDEPVIYPCHRVIRSDGTLGGYSLGGPGVKRRLLELEGVEFEDDGRVRRDHVIDLAEAMGLEAPSHVGLNS